MFYFIVKLVIYVKHSMFTLLCGHSFYNEKLFLLSDKITSISEKNHTYKNNRLVIYAPLSKSYWWKHVKSYISQ